MYKKNRWKKPLEKTGGTGWAVLGFYKKYEYLDPKRQGTLLQIVCDKLTAQTLTAHSVSETFQKRFKRLETFLKPSVLLGEHKLKF